MPTISANGGAERYWRSDDGTRLVLCRNGRLLIRAPGRRWREIVLPIEHIGSSAFWRADTGSRASASVTRTQRMWRRGG